MTNLTFAQELKLKSDLKPPAVDEFELCLFGKGYGECITIHLGNHKFLIVDSFMRKNSKRSVALDYLEHIGMSGEDVTSLLVSHWHDDHISGAFSIVESCRDCSIHISNAMESDEFNQLISIFSTSKPMTEKIRSGVEELGNILELLIKENEVQERLRLDFVSAKKLIYRGGSDEVFSLSPSSLEQIDAMADFTKLLPNLKKTKTVLRPIHPNNCAVALWIDVLGSKVILGADLEEANHANRGWQAICNLNPQIVGQSDSFKVPHHGSSTAHHDPVWTNHTKGKTTFALLTPFVRGNVKLPKKTDIQRIKGYSNGVYCTSNPFLEGKSKSRSKKVERLVKSATKSHRIIDTKLGLLRVRPSTGVECFGAAVKC